MGSRFIQQLDHVIDSSTIVELNEHLDQLDGAGMRNSFPQSQRTHTTPQGFLGTYGNNEGPRSQPGVEGTLGVPLSPGQVFSHLPVTLTNKDLLAGPPIKRASWNGFFPPSPTDPRSHPYSGTLANKGFS